MKKSIKASKPLRRRPGGEKQWKAFEKAYGLEEAGDFDGARRAYEHAARMGSPHAQINLAYLYDSGAFGFVDRDRARALNKRAFEQGETKGAYNLAQTYRMASLRRWYVYWLERAADAGDSDAEEELIRFLDQ
jgi:TPR repeat protein